MFSMTCVIIDKLDKIGPDGACVQRLAYSCWRTVADVQLLACSCWRTVTAMQLLAYSCWRAVAGMQLQLA
jgi:hypothetical protein